MSEPRARPIGPAGEPATGTDPAPGGKAPPTSFAFPPSAALCVPNERLDWFVGEIARVHAVELGNPRDKQRAISYVAPVKLRTTVRESLETLRSSTEQPLHKLTLHEPVDDLLLGRLLVATDFDAAKARDLAIEYSTWRGQIGGGVPPPQAPAAGSGGTSQAPAASGAFTIPFEDRHGRPVLVVKGRLVDASLPVEHYQNCFRACMDAMIVHFLLNREGSAHERNPLEQYVCVIETEGAGWSNVSLQFLRMLVQETNVYYPDRLQEIIVLGASSTVIGIWTVASPLVHPRTRKKVHLVPKDAIQATMQALVEPGKLPSRFGGTAAAPPLAAEGDEAAWGALAVAAWKHVMPGLGKDPVLEPS